MGSENIVKLDTGEEIKIQVQDEGGFIKEIQIEGGDLLEPADELPNLLESLQWVQLNPVALYTRIRFFTLKHSASLKGIDEDSLAQAIYKGN